MFEQRLMEHFCPPVHAIPHAPQLLPSESRFTQLEPQAVSSATQEHVPFEQVCELPHLLPHEPQLLRSVAKFTQTPLQLPLGHMLPELPPTPFVFEPPPGPSPLPFAQLYATRKTPIIPKKPIVKRMKNVLSTRAARMQLELYNLGRKYPPGRPVSVVC